MAGVHLFDVYHGESIPAGKKSLAYALTYQADGSMGMGNKPPFRAQLRDATYKRNLVALQRLANPYLPAAVDRVLARGLAPDPRRRPGSAGELVASVASALGGRWGRRFGGHRG